MTSECLLCGERSNKRYTIPNVIEVLHHAISMLETKSNEESIYVARANVLHYQVKELSAGSESLKEEKAKAEKRADRYKERFLDAQKTIQLLHEKNVQLSHSQKKASVKLPSLVLFESPATSISRISDAANETVLAPDTCGYDLMKRNPVSCGIGSDEEDFQWPQSRKSPKASKIPQKPKKNTIESYFIVPKSPAKLGKVETTVDLEETRLDAGGSMDVSASLTDSELEKLNEEMDPIPPSPVLTSHRQHLSLRKNTKWQKCGQTVLRPSGGIKVMDPEETFISKKIEASLEGDHTQTQKANTSLDEIFDKTDGDLETTSMLFVDSCNNTAPDDHDEDMDQLLLEDEDAKQDLTQMSPAVCQIQQSGIGRSSFDNSFDAPPKKEIVFKPNEVVRKKDEREKLESRSCPQCDAYYSDLTTSERKIALKKVCRHKMVNSPPSTPDNFWEVDIPSTAECRRRGYITDKTLKPDTEKQGNNTFRRKRPLQPFHGKKDSS